VGTLYTTTHLDQPRGADAHRAEIERLRRERQQKIAKVQADGERQRAEWDAKRQQERAIDIERQLTEDAIAVERRRQAIAYRRHLGLALTAEDRQWLLMDLRERDALDAADPDVVLLRRWLHSIARAHRIDLRESRLPQANNGSAVRSLRRVNAPPIQSYQSAATTGHEIGHILHADIPADAPSKPGEFGLGRICVQAELAAWGWLLSSTPVWNRAMHGSMTEAINSYRPHATQAECEQIDALISQRTYAETRLGAVLRRDQVAAFANNT
jgi:hypothetical protein